MNPIVTAPFLGLALTLPIWYAAAQLATWRREHTEQRDQAAAQELLDIDTWLGKIRLTATGRPQPDLTPLPCCGHPAGCHECGLCQVVLNEGDYGAPPIFCPCPDNATTDDDFGADMAHLNQLANAMLTQHPHTLRNPTIPIESQKFREDFGAWPEDAAAILLTEWATQR